MSKLIEAMESLLDSLDEKTKHTTGAFNKPRRMPRKLKKLPQGHAQRHQFWAQRPKAMKPSRIRHQFGVTRRPSVH